MDHPRTLVASAKELQDALAEGIDRITGSGGLIRIAPRLVIHPMERLEGGLTEVEARAITEATLALKPTECRIWIGEELTPASFASREFNGGSWY